MPYPFDTSEFISLYLEYLAELDSFLDSPPTESEAEIKRWALDYLLWDYAKIVPVTKKKHLVGFLIVCSQPECHPDCDWFIAQTYIKKEYRGKGIMSGLAKEYIRKNPGRYCLFIVNNNEEAKKFWRNVFRDLHYTEFAIADIVTPDECTQYAFRPKNTGSTLPCTDKKRKGAIVFS